MSLDLLKLKDIGIPMKSTTANKKQKLTLLRLSNNRNNRNCLLQDKLSRPIF